MTRVPGEPSSVYAFWNGMSPSTQNCVLELCARTLSVDSIAVFYNTKFTNWTSPGAGTALQIPCCDLPVIHVLKVFHCSHRVIELLFRLHVGFKEYYQDQDVRLQCPAHCVGNRSNQCARAPENKPSALKLRGSIRLSFVIKELFLQTRPGAMGAHMCPCHTASTACAFIVSTGLHKGSRLAGTR